MLDNQVSTGISMNVSKQDLHSHLFCEVLTNVIDYQRCRAAYQSVYASFTQANFKILSTTLHILYANLILRKSMALKNLQLEK